MHTTSHVEKNSEEISEATFKVQPSSPFDFPCKLENTKLYNNQNSISNADRLNRINQSKSMDINKRKGKNKKKMMDFIKLGSHHGMNRPEIKLILFAIFYFLCCLANHSHAAENHSFDEKIQKIIHHLTF